MEEAKKAKALQERIAGVFTPQTAMPTLGAASMPEVDTGVPPLPTSAGAAMPPAQAAAMPMNPNITRANQYRQAAQILAISGQSEQAMKYEDLAEKLDPRDEVQGAPIEVTNAQGNPVLLQQMKSGALRPVAGYGAKQGTIGQPFEMTDAKGKPVMVQQMPDGSFRTVVGFTPKQEDLTPEEKQLQKMGLPFTMANLAALKRAGAAPAADKAPRTQQVQLEDGTIGLINMDTGAIIKSTVGGVEVKGKGAGGNATEGERKAATLLSRMQLAEQDMVGQGERGMPGIFSSIAPRVMKQEERKRVEDAQLDFLDAALTLATGAAYTEAQLKGAMQSYFPKFGDDATTIQDKEARRKNLLESARIAAGRMGSSVPPLPPRPSAPSGSGGRPSLNNIFGAPGN
jgi:hypothetical protein